MDKLIDIRFKFYRNLPVLVGVCLFMYFSYHSVSGHRSYSQLVKLTASLQQQKQTLENLEQEKIALGVKVRTMRPDSLSSDMVDEQVRLILGYNNSNDIIVINN